MFLFCYFLNNKTALQHITIQLCSIAYLMNRKNYCRAESGFLMRPRVRVGFGLSSSGSGRVRAEPTRPDPIFGSYTSYIVSFITVKKVGWLSTCSRSGSYCIELWSWLRAFDAQLGHFHDGYSSLL